MGGWIRVITGCMFCGKTTELVRFAMREREAGRAVCCLKHSLDTRYAADKITAHSGLSVDAVPLSDSSEILSHVSHTDHAVVVDEAHFFDLGLTEVLVSLADSGRTILVAGMDQDYLGRPFGPVPALLAVADAVDKLKAVCAVCGAPASKSYLVAGQDKMHGNILVGAGEYYEPRCRDCYLRGVRERPS